MSYRNATAPNRAFEQTLSSMMARMERMEKRQRWQGAIRGPFQITDAGWSLSTGGSVDTPEDVAVEGGVWLVIAFCAWTDTGTDFGYRVEVDAARTLVGQPEVLIPLGDMDVIAKSMDGGRQRSTTFVGRVEFNAPFLVRFSTSANLAESASVGNISMSVLAFPG